MHFRHLILGAVFCSAGEAAFNGTGSLFGNSTASAAQAAAEDCTLYTPKSGDTCQDIFQHTNATYAQLLRWNPTLDPSCTNLSNFTSGICVSNPQGGAHTISSNTVGATSTFPSATPAPSPTGAGTNGNCGQYHLVKPGDDCGKILTKYGITLKDFVFLNPEVKDDCTNLWGNYYYCVSPVGLISDYPGYDGKPTRPPITTSPMKSTSGIFSQLPSITGGRAIPTASGTRKDCYLYQEFDDFTNSTLQDCWNAAYAFGVSPEEFIVWNPSLEQSTGSSGSIAPTPTGGNQYGYPCTLQTSLSYCMQLFSPTPAPTSTSAPPSPRASGEISGCTSWYAPEDYDTCEGILNIFQLSIDQFYKMNPSIGSDCTKMALGTYYCISTQSDGGPPPSGAPTTTTTSTPPAGATPSPIQDGMVANCNKFYKVVPGDGCYNLAHDQGISLDDFYKWNPAVKNDCTGLQAGYYVCIHVKG
ncbi:hypothetical protein LMH87_009498 [Akanthomyces muscarius]|uniref:LysM domain-containing protein n=1 Tax=Akanthomyces muscarius TaxID=2231603 RepID=A0A9W8UL25_AKAMU|nr:hypothetical protein LMH87_009498 [Akanthomyces muscarius]KAJ4152983.1 hypothetical protein LMH87_009498 [Akanthomyces muscarius]